MEQNPIQYTYSWLMDKYYSWREKYMRYRMYLDCKNGHHITFDAHHSFTQVWQAGKPVPRLVSHGRILIKNCRRCGKRVNTALEDNYFSNKR